MRVLDHPRRRDVESCAYSPDVLWLIELYTISPQRSAARNVHQRRTLLGVAAGLAAAYSRPTIDTTSHRVGARLQYITAGLSRWVGNRVQ